MSYDVIVIGGGLVGSAVAYGLSTQNRKVLVLDGDDRAFRASRGNFGLVWVQGKGWDFPPYAQWCLTTANLWPDFNQELAEISGESISYQRTGGFHFCINEGEWEQRTQMLSTLQQHTSGKFEFDMVDHTRLKQMIPQISNQVVGASFSPQDGHVDPLALLHGLHMGMNHNSVHYRASQVVQQVDYKSGEYQVTSNTAQYSAEKVVLCAGLGNRELGNMVGLDIPVIAERGQLMISERVSPFLQWPTLHVRQTAEGTIQIGDSHEDTGLDDGTDPFVLKTIAQRAVTMFPFLSRVKLIRAWGALRILTPDHNPIYQESSRCPGAYAITCHSGVTLAAVHAGPIAEWIAGKEHDPIISHFSTDRFNV